MNLMAAILDRAGRVAATASTAAALDPAATVSPANTSAAELPSAAGIRSMMALLRQRLPEVQTLLGLRDKVGSGGVDGGSSNPESGSTDKVVILRWRLLSLLDCYAQVIPEAIAAARFDFLKLLPSCSSSSPALSGKDESGAGRSDSNLSDLHPLIQLATLRLLSRDGVATRAAKSSGAGAGAGGGNSLFSGWLAQRASVGGSIGRGSVRGVDTSASSVSQLTTASHDLSGKTGDTPLSDVIRVALTAPSSTIRLAARALAVRALQTLGVVNAPTVSVRMGPRAGAGRRNGTTRAGSLLHEEDGSAADAWTVEGEAGVWLGLLSPIAIDAFVSLVRRACGDPHALMVAGIRAAEVGMKKEGREMLLVEGEAGNWEVEFRCAWSNLAGEII